MAHPYDGERLVARHFVSQRTIVPRVQLRTSIHKVDPVNIVLWQSLATQRTVRFIIQKDKLCLAHRW